MNSGKIECFNELAMRVIDCDPPDAPLRGKQIAGFVDDGPVRSKGRAAQVDMDMWRASWPTMAIERHRHNHLRVCVRVIGRLA